MMKNSSIALAVLALAMLLAAGASARADDPVPPTAKLLTHRRIWNGAPHNAFTDLIRWRDQWICAFREGASHVGGRGAIRVLACDDASDEDIAWRSLARIDDPHLDLRDANLSVAPDGRLMILGGAQLAGPNGRSTRSFSTFSADGQTWSPRQFVAEPGRWLWSVTWHDGVCWGVEYPAPTRPGVSSLVASRDGRTFAPVVDEFFTQSKSPTEARLRFAADGSALCLHRTDAKDDNAAWLGRAPKPYDQWNWTKLDRFIGGPNLIHLPTGEWLAAGRIFTPEPKTALVQLDPDRGVTTPILTLPSGGDTSYPGLVWHDDRLWMTYYSSHEQGTNIYLAEIDVTD
jgi:hypothetical protein